MDHLSTLIKPAYNDTARTDPTLPDADKMLVFALARADFLVEFDSETTITAIHGAFRPQTGLVADSMIGQPLRQILRGGHESDCAEFSVASRTGRRVPDRLMTLVNGRLTSWSVATSPDHPGLLFASVALVERRRTPR